jgi:hypothetical protein
LCIRNLRAFNLALLGKWDWKIRNKREGLWFIILINRYGLRELEDKIATTKKFAFSNRFSDRNISVVLATDLETDILSVKVKKYLVAKSVAT